MELTEDEVRIILEHRKAKAIAARQERDTLHLLDVALNFARWMSETRSGSSYSTFCNDYGYIVNYESGEENRATTHRRVLTIIDKAKELAAT